LSIYGVYIGATWRIQLNRPCAAAMRPYIKLLCLNTCYLMADTQEYNKNFSGTCFNITQAR